MGRLGDLVKSYERHISLKWERRSATERVIFCIYEENDELRLRAKIDEFELSTTQAGHQWQMMDLTDTFGHWLKTQRYVKSYFEKPELISDLMPKYLESIVGSFEDLVNQSKDSQNTVFALAGAGSMYGLLSIKELVEKLAPLTPGRILVFFPGSYENNNYRLLDGHDGWNYLSVPITQDNID